MKSINVVKMLEEEEKTKAKERKSTDAETIIRTHTLDEKVEEYYIKYAKPMLKELHKQDVIIYDTEALDNKTKSATTKIDKLVKKIITDKAKESKMYSLFKKIFGNEFIEKNDVIFSDNKEQKENFRNCIKTYIENNHDNIDYKAIDNIDFADMDEFKLN